jgi:hypothetical protein
MTVQGACLVVADESPEFPAALIYSALLAKAVGLRLIMLRVIEPAEPAPWATVSEEIKRQEIANAENLTMSFAAHARAECGVGAEILIREGEVRHEVKRLVDEEDAIKLVVLAAAAGAGGPGPLVASVAKGQGLIGFGMRTVPVLVVPGNLTKDEVRALALSNGHAHGSTHA